jgi:hypothetical protein
VVTSWSVRDGKGRLALNAIDGKPGRRRVVARGPTVNVTSGGVQRFAVRIPVASGQRLGVELGRDGFLPFRYLDEGATTAEFYIPPLGTSPKASEPGAGGTSGYEFLYNATIEPDADGDGQGDITQDRDHGGAGADCPTDEVLAKGAGSSVVVVGEEVAGCRGGVQTVIGEAEVDGVKLARFAFGGDQVALVRVEEGSSTVEIYDLGDGRRTLTSDKTYDDDRPEDWRVTDLVVAPNGDAAWIAIPSGAPDRAGLWTRRGSKVEQADSGALKAGSLRLDGDNAVTYTDTGGRERQTEL